MGVWYIILFKILQLLTLFLHSLHACLHLPACLLLPAKLPVAYYVNIFYLQVWLFLRLFLRFLVCVCFQVNLGCVCVFFDTIGGWLEERIRGKARLGQIHEEEERRDKADGDDVCLQGQLHESRCDIRTGGWRTSWKSFLMSSLASEKPLWRTTRASKPAVGLNLWTAT